MNVSHYYVRSSAAQEKQMARLVDKQARRAELVSAAAKVFAECGVAKTTVSDIARAASVAQGTLYLYFDDKDDIVLAVVENIVDQMIDHIENALPAGSETAVERFLALSDLLGSMNSTAGAAELIEILHHRENRALHDRMADRFMPRLVAIVEAVVKQGVAEGAFAVRDTRAAAWFVLGGLQSVELSGTTVGEMPGALAAATDLALRALGYLESRK
jgi:TetR/AcrR family fatty acid metabolism transcriptional regulator